MQSDLSPQAGRGEDDHYLIVNSTGIKKLIAPFLISSGIGGNGEA